jgi:hypothetical protein
MIQQASIGSRQTALLDFATEPFVMLDGIRQEVQGNLIGSTTGLHSEAIEFGFEFWWNLEIHSASVSWLRVCVD